MPPPRFSSAWFYMVGLPSRPVARIFQGGSYSGGKWTLSLKKGGGGLIWEKCGPLYYTLWSLCPKGEGRVFGPPQTPPPPLLRIRARLPSLGSYYNILFLYKMINDRLATSRTVIIQDFCYSIQYSYVYIFSRSLTLMWITEACGLSVFIINIFAYTEIHRPVSGVTFIFKYPIIHY